MSLLTKAKNLLKQKECKTEGGVCYPPADYAVVPDKEKSSTWKLRLSQGSPGNITVSQLGRAAAAFSSGGFRGNRVQLSTKEVSQAKARIRREYRKLNVKPDNIPDSVKEKTFNIWLDKETNQYRWLATYSNKFRDDDNPPEIISEASHRSFVKGVETGVYPYPELWLWHIKNSRVGISDWLHFTDEGFAVASGTIDQGKEHIAKGLLEQPDDLVSHGMPRVFVKRDPEDETIIIQHITKEISPLPSGNAANKLTGFELLSKEDSMIPEHKLEYLKAVGVTDDEIEEFKANIGKKADKAKEDELESKANTQEAPVDEKQNAGQELTLESIAGLLEAGFKPFADQINALKADVKELKITEEDRVSNTPPASQAALLQGKMEDLFGKESKVDGRTTIAKSGPKQTPTKQAGVFFEDWMTPAVEEGVQ